MFCLYEFHLGPGMSIDPIDVPGKEHIENTTVHNKRRKFGVFIDVIKRYWLGVGGIGSYIPVPSFIELFEQEQRRDQLPSLFKQYFFKTTDKLCVHVQTNHNFTSSDLHSSNLPCCVHSRKPSTAPSYSSDYHLLPQDCYLVEQSLKKRVL